MVVMEGVMMTFFESALCERSHRLQLSNAQRYFGATLQTEIDAIAIL